MDTGILLYTKYTSSQKYSCFSCRVCFHKPRSGGAIQKCPTCKQIMLQCGTAFRAPRKRNIKEWAKLEILVRAGLRFNYCGGNGQIKGLTRNDVKSFRKAKVFPTDNENVGKVLYAVRSPGSGKRIKTKAWFGIESYHLPE